MKAVGIKKLKDNLSKYLKLVVEGEVIYVTDRDEVIAEIHKPISPIADKITPWEAFLNIEEQRGSIKRAETGKSPPLHDLKNFDRPKVPIVLQTLLDEIREDR